MTEIMVEIHDEEFEIQFEDGSTDECVYLCTLTSEIVRRWKSQEPHKQFMYQVIRRLPWRDKAGAFIEDGHLMLAWSDEYEGNNVVPPFEIKPSKLLECPIPTTMT
jgi:hypothetical protein